MSQQWPRKGARVQAVRYFNANADKNHHCTPRTFTTHAVAYLCGLWRGSLTLHADQWFGVEYKARDGFEAWIECDYVEDGLAELVLIIRDRRAAAALAGVAPSLPAEPPSE